ncbi:sulfur carrier protein ThiS [Paramagnetospirillum magnetotacticum]|uniref:sulfur carrier protein ThiS n=1 Tax=Paramagnetospirillum magnetotacticum TaxID=188 RepID=UPI001F4053FD|nr:MoaD/ThiS family protein [Paramagnetospirillum magnetotacticum]
MTLKLFALLGRHLPPGSVANATEVDMAEESDIGALIAHFGLSDKDCHLVLLNGAFVPPDARTSTRLSPGDTVSIWPPIGGG